MNRRGFLGALAAVAAAPAAALKLAQAEPAPPPLPPAQPFPIGFRMSKELVEDMTGRRIANGTPVVFDSVTGSLRAATSEAQGFAASPIDAGATVRLENTDKYWWVADVE